MISILGHFRRLLDFSGRESRASFWPYTAVVFAITMVGGMAVMLPGMMDMFDRMQQFAIDNPDQATITQGPGHYSITIEGHHPELMPDLGAMVGGIAFVSVVAIALLAAAVTRRLHDRGSRGLWGLLPVPFLFSGFYLMPRMFRMSEPDMELFGLLFANNAVYLASLGFLAYLLASPGNPDANRFGPA
jgi:uncharacterized membrane protein YhaH (DUF805 family)